MSRLFDTIKSSWQKTLTTAREKKSLLIVFSTVFVAMLTISVFDVVTSKTVFSVSLSEYSVNQISDRTIIAEKSLKATGENSVSITQGEKIIRKGFPITQEQYEKLRVIAETPAYLDFKAFRNAFLFLVMLSFVSFFLFSKLILGRELLLKEAIFIAITVFLVYIITIVGKKSSLYVNPYTITMIIPSSFFIMLITIMFGPRLAVFSTLIISVSVLYASSFALSPALFVLCSGFFAILIVSKAQVRIQLTVVAIVLALLNILSLYALQTVFATPLDRILIMTCFGVAINGFISGICILGFLTPLEYLFNTASIFRLLDLSDLNNPLMKRMLFVAPGTYNHSMLVATLAENTCNEIGANGLLARVGAYYHDIGKIEQAEYFVENQREGNKHDEINPRLSVSVIRNHVKKGIEKCNQLHFPKDVIDIVAQHHGNSTIYFFYSEAKKTNPNLSQDDFSYIGTCPTTKEAAVVMICDTIEAACRTLKDPSVSRLNKFIKKLIADKVEDNQLSKANLTFSDLTKIQESLVDIMAGYYHSRIEYPSKEEKSTEKKNTEEDLHKSIEKEVINEG